MHWHSGQQDLRERRARPQPPAGRPRAARAPARRQRGRRHLRRRGGRRRGRRGQRAGLPGPRRRAVRPPVVLPRERASSRRRSSPRSSSSSTTRARSIPSLIVVQSIAEGSELPILEEILAERRGGGVEIRASERGGKRRILDLAERNARLALEQEKKAERPAAAGRGARRAGRRSGSTRCRSASSASTSRTSAAPTRPRRWLFFGGAPKKSDYRRFNIREVDPGDDYAAMRRF